MNSGPNPRVPRDPNTPRSGQTPSQDRELNAIQARRLDELKRTAIRLLQPGRYATVGIGILVVLIALCLIATFLLSRNASNAGLGVTPIPGGQARLDEIGKVPPSTPFTVRGSGFQNGERVEIFAAPSPDSPFDEIQKGKLGETTVGADGKFELPNLSVPPDRAPSGVAYVVARGSSSGFTPFVGGDGTQPTPLPPTLNPGTPIVPTTPAPGTVIPGVTQTPTPPPSNLPDLVIGTVSIDYQPGVDCTVAPQLGLRFDVRNVGGVPTGLFVVRVNGTDLTVGTGLQANQSIQLWAPGYAQGQNQIIIDSTNNVAESNEQNNQVFLSVPVPTSSPRCQPTNLPPPTAPAPSSPTVPAPSVTPDPNAVGVWYGRYYPNVDLAEPAALVRSDVNLNFDWRTGSPGPGIPVDNFSASWTRNEDFATTDNYEFSVTMDDGARVYFDGVLVLDEWFNGGLRTKTFNRSVTQGRHLIRVDYYEATGNARIAMTWKVKYSAWVGRYYNSVDRSGPVIVKRDDPNLDFTWGFGSPDGAVTADNFSADWQRTVNFAPGTYVFTATVDDGVRLLIDNVIVMDRLDAGAKVVVETRGLTGGNHSLQVQYSEYTGNAYIKLEWAALPPPPTPTPSPTVPPSATTPPTATLPPTAAPPTVEPPTATTLPPTAPPLPPSDTPPAPTATLPVSTPTETATPPLPTDTPVPPTAPIVATISP